MNNRNRRERPDSTELPLHAAIQRLGRYGQELEESLAWCQRRGLEGFVEFYLDEIWYQAQRRSVRAERRRDDAREEAR